MSGVQTGVGISPLNRWRLVCAMAMAICALVVSVPRAQTEIEASATRNNSTCVLAYNRPGLYNVYIRLTFNSGAAAARFRLEPGPGISMAYVSESSPYSSVGFAFAGISVCFGGCVTGDALIATVTFLTFGTDTPCSELRVVPHPGAQTVEVLKCNGSTVAAYAQGLAIAPPDIEGFPIFCECPTPHLFPGTPMPFDCTPPVAVEPTTWGRVKALYRN